MRTVARVIVGVTGGIAAYKACELVRLLIKDGHEVIPLLTPGAERFVTQETFDALARRKDDGDPYPHLRRAELVVVAPLSANTLAKLTHGLADNVLTEAALAHDGPLLVAPAMNPRMWANPATQANVAILRERGAEVIGPEEGELAEGEHGVGRMTEPAAILSRVRALLAPGALAGRQILVSAGGTREPLDSVRFVGNRSSGRMGVALAAEARRRGADVTLLAANLGVAPPAGVAVVDTPTAADMLREAAARADADAVLMAAAVADYRPAGAQEKKRSKDEHTWNVELVPTEDVLASIGARRRNGQVLVAFGADHGDAGLQRKRAMLKSKSADLVVFNDIGRNDIGFDSPDNEVVLVTRAGERTIAKAPKAAIAAAVLDEVARLLEERDGRGR
jgi:phosphopantothenoylcysteine decarboxylase / phosphopantothenate---cysteine ligase